MVQLDGSPYGPPLTVLSGDISKFVLFIKRLIVFQQNTVFSNAI